MSDALRFDGQVAIVTGASKGLGRAYAHWLAARGCAVVVNNRLGQDGASSAALVANEIVHAGGRAIAHDGAAEDPQACRDMVTLAESQFGRLDILICNAGVQTWADFSELTPDLFRRVLDVSLWGTLYALQAAWPGFIQRGYGRIVLTSSTAGLWGQPKSVPYSASKAAICGVARGVTLDTPAHCNIKTNVIAPAAYTPMSAKVIDDKWADYMSADRVAPVVGWLASQSCTVSGMIFHAGAGRVRRVQVVEGERVEVTADNVDDVMRVLSQDSQEPDSSFGSGAELMPEMFEDLGIWPPKK